MTLVSLLAVLAVAMPSGVLAFSVALWDRIS